MKYQVRISTFDPARGYAGLTIVDEGGERPETISLPLLVSFDATDREIGQAADSILGELNWTRTGSWNVTGTWDTPGVHMYADVMMTADLEWPAGKKFGELTPEQKQYQAKKAGRRLTAEMSNPAFVAALSALLDEDDAAAVERHLGL